MAPTHGGTVKVESLGCCNVTAMNQTESSSHRRGSPTWILSCLIQANALSICVTKYVFKIITELFDFDWLFYNQTFCIITLY